MLVLDNAAAEMLESDRKRLAAMIEAAKRQSQSQNAAPTMPQQLPPPDPDPGPDPDPQPDQPTTAQPTPPSHPLMPPRPPRALIPVPHPLTANASAVRPQGDTDTDPLARDVRPGSNGLRITRSNVRAGALSQMAAPRRARADSGRPKPTQQELRARRMKAAKRILAATPDIGTRELARRIAMATSYRISESTAHAIRESLRANTSANVSFDADNAATSSENAPT